MMVNWVLQCDRVSEESLLVDLNGGFTHSKITPEGLKRVLASIKAASPIEICDFFACCEPSYNQQRVRERADELIDSDYSCKRVRVSHVH